MDKPRVRLGQVADLDCYGVELRGVWVPCGTWEEAMSWAGYLVQTAALAERMRRGSIQGPGHWLVARFTRGGPVFLRSRPVKGQVWTKDPDQAYGWADPDDARDQLSGVATTGQEWAGIEPRRCRECKNDLTALRHKMDCNRGRR